MAAKLKLDIGGLTDDFFDDCRLLGMVAPVKNYQLCWNLNQLLRSDFRLNPDIEIRLNKKNRQYYFPVYEFKETTNFLGHYLYCNQHDGEYLLPEFKHLDYLWLLKGDLTQNEKVAAFIEAIKSIPSVQMVMELSLDKIKNKENMIF